jgi:hypothetical protein
MLAELGHQTGGPGKVVSLYAVGDVELHGNTSVLDPITPSA